MTVRSDLAAIKQQLMQRQQGSKPIEVISFSRCPVDSYSSLRGRVEEAGPGSYNVYYYHDDTSAQDEYRRAVSEFMATKDQSRTQYIIITATAPTPALIARKN